MSYKNSKNKTKLYDLSKIRRDLRGSLFMVTFLWIITIILNYAKSGSTTFLYLGLGIIIVSLICTCIVSVKVKKDKRIFYLFESFTQLLVALSSFAICLTSYYVYLGFTNVLFTCSITTCAILVAFITLRLYKRALLQKNVNKNNRKISGVITGTAASFSIIGCFIARQLMKSMDQKSIHIVVIAIFLLLSYTFIMTSTINLLKYKQMQK